MEFKCIKIDGVLIGLDDEAIKQLAELGDGATGKFILDDDNQRTLTQNKAMHKYFELLAEALNEAGYDMKRLLKEEVDIPWTKESVKEHLWKPIQEIMIKAKSTTELNTAQPNNIYLVLSRHIGEKTGVYVDWPNRRG